MKLLKFQTKISQPYCSVLLQLMLVLSRFQRKHSSSSFPLQGDFSFAVQVKLHKDWSLIWGQKVSLTQKFVKGHGIQKLSLPPLHSCIIKNHLCLKQQSAMHGVLSHPLCYVETKGLIGAKFEEVPVLACSTLQQQSEGDLLPRSVLVFHMTSE